MSKLKNIKVVILISFLIAPQQIFSAIRAKGKSSRIHLRPSTRLTITKPILEYNGTLIKAKTSTIEGSRISFIRGALEENGNKVLLSGDLTPQTLNKIVLDGDKSLRATTGIILQSVEIRNFNNKIEGAILVNNLTLQDENSSVTLAISNRIPCDITLNNGSIYLQEDLNFVDDKKITGSGKIFHQNRKLIFNGNSLTFTQPLTFGEQCNIESNVNLNLNSTWNFDGTNNILDCKNNILNLQTGSIVVQNDSDLILRNATIKNLKANNIRCLNNNGKIILQNVKLVLSDDFSFQKGSIEIHESVEISRPYIFAYQTNQTSTIKSNSFLILDKHVTFSYDPGIASKNLIELEDTTSYFALSNATLHTTATGIQLTNGNLILNENVYFAAEKEVYYIDIDSGAEDLNEDVIEIEGGICLGDGNAQNDIKCEIANIAMIHVTQGSLIYKNVNDSSWIITNQEPALNIYPDATLQLHQNLDLKDKYTNFYKGASLDKLNGSQLIGVINRKV